METGMSHTVSKREVRRFGVFEVDLQSRELRRNGVLVRLQEHQFEMLAALLERPGEVVTREEISARLWKDGTFVDYEAGLNTAAKRLRDALGDTAENPRFVQTLPKRGYRFIAPVEGGPKAGEGRKGRLAWVAIGVAAVAIAAVIVWRAATPVKITSLAVLPMENLSRDEGEEYLADGMTEAVISSLAQVRSLDKVISRTSVMQFKGTKTPAPEIARKLGVKGIVEGSVQRQGDRVRVTVQLIDAARDRHLWSRSYDRDLRDVLILQSEIARAIADEVQAALAPEERTRLAAARKVNPEAYRLYARGRRLCDLWSSEGMHKGIALLEEAMVIDPEFGPPYSAACLCLIYLTQFGVSPPS
jgi:TolB-like protein/DNA-binding winged helix-turn-helix (wHTH) protein